MTERIVVIGGGVAGSSAAWRLAERGADVTLLEQFDPRHTHGSSWGTSRIFRLAYPDALYVSLATRALELWRELEAVTGSPVLTLTGALDHGPEEATSALARALADAGHAHELLTPAEAAARWPQFRFDASVLFHPDGGRVHADDAVTALQSAAVRAGATVRHRARVSTVRSLNGRAEVVLASGERLDADVAVVAAGGWLPTLFGDLAELPPLRVTQEQPVFFPAPGSPSWPSFIHHAADGVYGMGDEQGVKIGHHAIGPVVDPDHRDRSVDPARVEALADYARAWLPTADARRPSPLTCLYISTPSGDFVIDAPERHGGAIVIASPCSGHGFKHGPAVGELIAALALDRTPPPARFSLESVRAAAGGSGD